MVIALAALVESVWCAALAAAVTKEPWWLFMAFAWPTLLFAAWLARRAGGRRPRRLLRLLALVMVAGVAALLLTALQAWTQPHVVRRLPEVVLVAGGLMFLGLRLGLPGQAPEDAVRRALRSFALTCAVLAFLALSRMTPQWAPAAIATALFAGSLLVATARYRTLAAKTAGGDSLPRWSWLIAVAAVSLGVLAAGAALSQLLSVGLLQEAFGVLKYGFDAAAYGLGWIEALSAHGIRWALALLGVGSEHAAHLSSPVSPPRYARGGQAPDWHVLGLLPTIAGIVGAIALAIAVAVLGLRRVSAETPVQDEAEEEREEIVSLQAGLKRSASTMGRRVRQRLQALRPGRETPGEVVRRRYAELERRLAGMGFARPAGTTVRDHLEAISAPDEAVHELATIYELTRYSLHRVEQWQAQRFEALATDFAAQARAGRQLY
jgi:hypothetical protein